MQTSSRRRAGSKVLISSVMQDASPCSSATDQTSGKARHRPENDKICGTARKCQLVVQGAIRLRSVTR